MAIQRCPYCKAIIDEGAEYCTNCGTKLLFPEDEFVEEEIPGEPIIDVEEDMTGEQQKLEEPPEPEAAEEEGIELSPDTGETEAPEEERAEVKAMTESPEEKKPAPKKRKKPGKKAAPKKAEAEEAFAEAEEVKAEETEAEDLGAPPEIEEVTLVDDEAPVEVEEEMEPEPIPEEELTPQPGAVDEREWQTPPPEGELQEPEAPDPEPVDTGDIEDIVDEAEKEKEEIDKFIASVKKERQTHRAPVNDETQDIPPWVENVENGPLPDIPPTDEVVMSGDASQAPMDKPVEEPLGDPAGPPVEEPVSEPSDEPRKTSVIVPLDQLEELSGEVETSEAPAPGLDTRSAFPETVDQQGLPFVSKSESLDDMDTEETAQYEESGSQREVQSVGFIDWLKARAFDVVFVAALWFVALWIASQVLSVSVFRIISDSTIVAIVFLALLLAIYFFYFMFFLGETLGNYLFSSDE